MKPAAYVDEQFDDLDQQSEAATFGMWVFLATEVLFFGVLFGAYLYCRVQDAQGFALASRHTGAIMGGLESAILLGSAALVAWATALLRQDCQHAAARLITLAAVLGGLFLALHLHEYYQHWQEGLVPGLNWQYQGLHAATVARFFSLYYAMTLAHLAHLSVGIVLLLVYARAVRRGRYGRRYATPVLCVALYWDFVDLVWIYLYPLLYLVDRS